MHTSLMMSLLYNSAVQFSFIISGSWWATKRSNRKSAIIQNLKKHKIHVMMPESLKLKRKSLNLHLAVSQAARQGLAVLMASASVVLKHETSTLRQRHNFISIDLKFRVSDYVREVTRPAKFGSCPMSGRDATWGQHIRVLWVFKKHFLLFFCFYILQQSYSPYPWTNFSAQ